MTGTALVTGASSGIGRELAREHARRGGDLLLVARRAKELKALAKQISTAHGVDVKVLPLDLATPDAPQKVVDWIASEGAQVDVLVNNAGFGGHGALLDRDLAADLLMIQLNISTLVALTRLLVPGMVERGHGRVLQVGSTAGFLPGPLQATYYATKAFVNSFSQAVAEELRGTGVTVTVLCPGPVATEFAQVAGMGGNKLFQGAATPERVAADGYEGMEQGRDVVLSPRGMALLVDGLLPMLPRKLVLKASRKAMEG